MKVGSCAPNLTRKHPRARTGRAITLLDCLVVMVVVAMLVWFVILPSLARSGTRRVPRIQCANNLKQVGLAFRQFATDNNDQSPQSLSTNEGGIKELLNVGSDGTGDPTQTFWVFTAMSNELATPKTVRCPSDKQRAAISNFCGMAYATPLAQGGQNASLSYFVNLAADPNQPLAILAGDRNLSTVTNAKRASDYDAFFRVEQRIRPADAKPGGGYASLEFQKSIHYFAKENLRQGNILLADGSVRPATGPRVRELILASTNELRLIFPFVPGKNE